MLPQQSQMFGFSPTQSFLPNRWLEEGETVTIGNVPLAVIYTLGHIPGHVIFYSKDDQLALVGDVLFHGLNELARPLNNLASLNSCGY
jgi:hydroxyacylglutathione hydrolase